MFDQLQLTNRLVEWLKANPWKPDTRVRYDGETESPFTPDAEHCSLYIGAKLKGIGWSTQIAQVDILVEDQTNKTVDLLVEIDPNVNPKKVLGEVLPVLIADSYTPSGLYGEANRRYIKNAVFIFVTVVPDGGKSQKRAQLRGIEEAVIDRLDFKYLNIQTIRFCVGSSEEDALYRCQQEIRTLMWPQSHSTANAAASG